jgi:hypothetical protein
MTVKGRNMEIKSKSPELIERIGRFVLFRAVVYLLPIFYAIRLTLMIVTPQAYHMPSWRTVLWQGARDFSVVLMLLTWRRYFAFYTARRTSLRLRRTDTWQLPLVTCLYLSLDMPSLLELPWALVLLVSLAFGVTLYLWEMREIKRLEAGMAHPLPK